jgi:hypothetical protein
VRHVAVALNALEETEGGSALILLEGQIRHSWLSTLLYFGRGGVTGR